MVAIITEKFKLHNASQFTESFSEASASTYYMFIGKPTEFNSPNAGTGASASVPPTPLDSVSDEFYFWEIIHILPVIFSTPKFGLLN